MFAELTNPLWQSTIFVVPAGILTLALRRNRAQVRYWVWFAASVKFLVPFSLLVGLGALTPRRVAAPVVPTQWVIAAEQIGEPLATLPVAVVRGQRENRNYLGPAALVV